MLAPSHFLRVPRGKKTELKPSSKAFYLFKFSNLFMRQRNRELLSAPFFPKCPQWLVARTQSVGLSQEKLFQGMTFEKDFEE